MKTISFGNTVAQDFGSNNYSCGMSAIIFNPKDISVEEVKQLDGVFLHPTVEPNSMEIFALLGNKEQFDQFYDQAVESRCFKEVVNIIGMKDSSKVCELAFGMCDKFIPWYN